MGRSRTFVKTMQCLICLLLGGVLVHYSARKSAVLYEIALLLVFFILMFKHAMSRRVARVVSIFFGISMIIYNIQVLYPYLTQSDSAPNVSFTQVNIPNQEWHKDMWITPIIRNRTVNLSYTDDWCKPFFEQFSTQIVDEDISAGQTADLEKISTLYDVGVMILTGYQDAFSEQTLAEISRQEQLPRLYIDIDGITNAEEIMVLNDDKFNIYLIAAENFSLYCGGGR